MFLLVIWSVVGLIILREEILHLKFEWDRGFLDIAMQPMIQSPPLDRRLIPLALLGRYFQLLVMPVKLSIDYGLSVTGATIARNDPYLWLGAAVLAGWTTGLCVSLARRKWTAAFCLLAMALTYSMASNVVLIAAIFGERLMYLPSVFFVILVAMAMAKLRPSSWGILGAAAFSHSPSPGTPGEGRGEGLSHSSPHPNPLPEYQERGRYARLLECACPGGILLAVLLVLASLRTYSYVRRWNDRYAFYQYALKEQPKSLKIHLLVAFADYEEGRLPEARRIMDDAIAIYPNYWELWKMNALIDMKAGDWDKAVADWKRAFDLHPAGNLSDQLAKAMRMRNAHGEMTRSAK